MSHLSRGTKPYSHKYDKIGGGVGGAPTAYIEQKKVRHFCTLFGEIKEREGNYEKARALVKMSNDDMSNMKNRNKLSAIHAKRILSTHKKLIR